MWKRDEYKDYRLKRNAVKYFCRGHLYRRQRCGIGCRKYYQHQLEG
jgi:hypothetical protein